MDKEKYLLIIEIITPEMIQTEMKESGATSNKENSFVYLERESRQPGGNSLFSGSSNGLLDFSTTSPILDNKDNKLFIEESTGKVYNRKDFGNFLWGQAGANLGFDLKTLKIGAHIHNAFKSKKDNPDLDYKLLDTQADQNAIEDGYNFKN